MGARTLGAGRAGRARLSAVMVSAFFCAAQADAQPVPRGPEFQVSTYTMGNQLAPVAAANGTGFVVAWKSYQNGPAPTLFARRFDLSGITLTGEIPVNTNTSGQSDAAIASSATGFVVVWTGLTATPTESSGAASTPPATRWAPSSRPTRTPREGRPCPTWRWTPPASSWSGRGEPVSARTCSRDATTWRATRWLDRWW